MPVKDVVLYSRQLQMLRDPARELLAVGDGGGKSHALRAGLVLTASSVPGRHVVLVHPNGDELRRDHVEGPTGFKAMLAEAAQAGAVEFRPGVSEARFRNGSRLCWIGLDRPSEVRRLVELPGVTLACLDEAHRVAADQFELLAEKVRQGNGRVIAAAGSLSGWLEERWSVNGHAGRKVIETRRADLPEKLRVTSELPTIEEFMDRLGVPFLATDSAFRRARHVQTVVGCLQRWFWGEYQNLMILMPTQLGKTLVGVRVAAAYIAYCRAYETVGVTSYETKKTYDRSRDARDFYLKAGGHLRDGATAVDYWKTPYGGGVWAAGFAAGQSGNPMTWGIVDDPDADLKQSRSQASIRDKDDWYQYVWLGRESKFADRRLSQLWLATRFWRRDTVGRTLEFHVERGDPWHLCVLPAIYDPEIAENYRRMAPGLITVEPDFRTEPGEPIYPEKFPRDYWEKNRHSSLRTFMARDQQWPESAEGAVIFNETWPIDLAVDPAFTAGRSSPGQAYLLPVRAWDLGATAGAGDWTACVALGEERDSDRLVVRHAARARLGTHDVLRFIAGTMLLDGSEVTVVLPEDPAAAGKQQTARIVDYLRKVSKSVSVRCPECRGKGCSACYKGRLRFRLPLVRTVSTKDGIMEYFETFADRATPISDQVEGNVDYVDADWTPRLRDAVPWWSKAVESQTDRDVQAELLEIDRLMGRFVSGRDPDLEWVGWQTPYFRELHLYPDVDHDDWVAATVHGWRVVNAPRSFYPKG